MRSLTLFILVIILTYLSTPSWAGQNQEPQLEEEQTESSINDVSEEHLQLAYLRSFARIAQRITEYEILRSPRYFRYEGGLAGLIKDFNSFTVNELAERFNFNNMERLEFLKTLLDTGFVPLSPLY